jgi:hypothetical protein
MEKELGGMMTNIIGLINQRIKYNKRKVKECEEFLEEVTASPEAAKLVGMRFYHLGAVKELNVLLDEINNNRKINLFNI